MSIIPQLLQKVTPLLFLQKNCSSGKKRRTRKGDGVGVGAGDRKRQRGIQRDGATERWRQRKAAVDGRHSSVQSQTWQLVTGDKIKRSCHF